MKAFVLALWVNSYLATAKWSSCEEDAGDLDAFEWSEQAKEQAEKDCQLFIEKVREAFPDTADQIICREANDLDYLAPHDFWLTRAGDGAGFWDGDWEDYDENGAKLTAICKEFKHLDVYKGDDDLLHFF